MNPTYQKFFQILILSVITISLSAQTGNYISMKQRTEILENRKKLTNEVDLYYDKNKQTITKYYHSSPEFIMNINALGEIKTYYPKSNEVGFKHVPELSSKRNLIYYFINNFTDHLGLADEGFQLVSSTYENQHNITVWKAPSFLKNIESVKMVFDNGLPIFAEYQAHKKKIIKKIYYTNYKNFTQFRFPQKIIEISYLPAGDSLINRTVFSEISISPTTSNPMFNFKIPDDAKPVEVSENR